MAPLSPLFLFEFLEKESVQRFKCHFSPASCTLFSVFFCYFSLSQCYTPLRFYRNVPLRQPGLAPQTWRTRSLMSYNSGTRTLLFLLPERNSSERGCMTVWGPVPICSSTQEKRHAQSLAALVFHRHCAVPCRLSGIHRKFAACMSFF